MLREVKAIQKTIHQTSDWINDMMDTYDYDSENDAFVVLRATLKALRDRSSMEEALHLGNGIPALMRGFYFEGWEPAVAKKADFYSSVKTHLGGHDEIDLEMAVPEALNVIFKHLDNNQIALVKQNLSEDFQGLWS